MISLVFGRR